MAKAGDFFLKEITHCSKAFSVTLSALTGNLLYEKIYKIALNKISIYLNLPNARVLIAEAVPSSKINDLVGHLSRNMIYKPCIDKVNVNWKSQIGLLLGGIIYDMMY